MYIRKSVENVGQLAGCQVLRLEVASIYSPNQRIRKKSAQKRKRRERYQLTKYAVVLYPLVALSTTELDISRAASREPENVGIDKEGGARERRSNRFLVDPNMMAVEAEAVK